jgi:flagellar biosynthesis protein FlhF
MQRVPFMNYPQNCHNFYKKIVSAGIEEEFAKQLMDEVVSNNSMRALQEKDFLLTKFQEALLHHLQIAGPIKLDGQGNVIVLVGPTGVGKTTTLVKLAAEFAFKKEKKVAFITIDTYRVAAVEQLKVYASILNAPLKVVFSPDEFQKALDEFSICDVVFVDTGGRSQRNIIQIAELSRFLQPCIQRLDIHLLLSATTKYKDLLSTIESFKEVGAKKVIITKVDETESGGALLSALAKAKMGISYITMGQNVPEDIEVATPQRVVQMLFGAQ